MNSTIEFTRKEYNLIAKNRGIKEPENMSTKELLDTLSRYDTNRKVNSNRRKIFKMGLEKIAKLQNISKDDLSRVEQLQNNSIKELHEIARLRGFKKLGDLTKEDLIFRFLKSESNLEERNYMKYFNNGTSDVTYNNKIKSRINDIRLILSRLRNIVSDRKKIKKGFMKQKKSKTFRIMKKKIFMMILSTQQISSIKKKNTNVIIVMMQIILD